MILEYPCTISDYVQIILIAAVIYNIMVWLRKDKHTPLLAYAYCYGIIAFVAYMFELHIILALLPIVTPLFLVAGIILHQESLQKNIITHKHVAYTSALNPRWLEQLISSALVHINTQKSVTFIIEHTDDLSPFLMTPYLLNTNMHKQLLDMVLNPHVYDGLSMLWIQSSGIVMSPQTTWKNQNNVPFDSEISKEMSVLYTQKTDALVCIIDQQTRTCMLIVHGNVIPMLTTHQAMQLIQKHIQRTAHQVVTHKKVSNETTIQNNHL